MAAAAGWRRRALAVDLAVLEKSDRPVGMLQH